MRSKRPQLITVLGLVVLVEIVYFHNRYLYFAFSSVFMLCVALGAIIVGAIPRWMRTQREKIVRWIIGWPMFVINFFFMAFSAREIVVLNAPEWVLISSFFWVLTYLTWKIFIDPNTGSGGWWRRGRSPRPRGPVPRPSRSRPIPIRDSGASVLRGDSVPK